ncbi:hypothetical protein [Neptunitalea lumnitzerae]|nr:hypothetical protein [Neptunitalea sp. Y10]
MIKAVWFCVVCMACGVLSAQKIISKEIAVPSVSLFTINTTHVFDLTITTGATDKVFVEAFFDGEYKEGLFITTQIDLNKLVVGVDYSPVFESFDDKLAAHKVLSVKMKLVLPKDKVVIVNGANTTSHVTGTYKNLQLYMNTGDCFLDAFEGNATIETFNGSVIAGNYKGIVKAASDYGKVQVLPNEVKLTTLNIHTVNGNISVNTKK